MGIMGNVFGIAIGVIIESLIRTVVEHGSLERSKRMQDQNVRFYDAARRNGVVRMT